MAESGWMTLPTPVQYLGRGPAGQHLYIKRDDLAGPAFGGNKARILSVLLEDMRRQGGNCLVSYGSTRSNLNRTAACLCRRLSIPCAVITPQETEEEEEETFNSQMVRQMGVRQVRCRKTQVAETVDEVMEACTSRGYRPYYVYGNRYGTGNEAVVRRAYRQAYREIRGWEEAEGVRLDAIFLASGTGMTQGGLLAGRQEMGGSEQIIGISAARDKEAGTAGVVRYAGSAAAEPEEVQFLTEYRCGGYGRYDASVEAAVQMAMERYGIPLDPVYTGKAFAGMLDVLSRGGCRMEHVLFLHTGGLPLYFDYLKSLQRRN